MIDDEMYETCKDCPYCYKEVNQCMYGEEGVPNDLEKKCDKDKLNMKRLTEKIEEHYIPRQERLNGKIVGNQMCLDKLGEYENLEEQGLLLVIPNEAYFIKDNMVCKGWVQELVYSPCKRLLLDIRYNNNSLDSYRGYVGDTVFLMQEAAEQKLTEIENE